MCCIPEETMQNTKNKFYYIHQGSHGQGKVREKWFFFKVREKSGNFEIGQRNLKNKQKSGKKSGNFVREEC